MEKIVFQGAFEKLTKDREGEVRITFTVPLSDEAIARTVPIQTPFQIAILYEITDRDSNETQDTGCGDL